MIDYVKTILMKVSFDANLFEKELRKGINALAKAQEELTEFRGWCYAKFSKRYGDILDRCFARVAV